MKCNSPKEAMEKAAVFNGLLKGDNKQYVNIGDELLCIPRGGWVEMIVTFNGRTGKKETHYKGTLDEDDEK